MSTQPDFLLAALNHSEAASDAAPKLVKEPAGTPKPAIFTQLEEAASRSVADSVMSRVASAALQESSQKYGLALPQPPKVEFADSNNQKVTVSSFGAAAAFNFADGRVQYVEPFRFFKGYARYALPTDVHISRGLLDASFCPQVPYPASSVLSDDEKHAIAREDHFDATGTTEADHDDDEDEDG